MNEKGRIHAVNVEVMDDLFQIVPAKRFKDSCLEVHGPCVR